MFAALMKSWRLRQIKKRIAYLEQQEARLVRTLKYLRTTVLPEVRSERNTLMFGRPTTADAHHPFWLRVLLGRKS